MSKNIFTAPNTDMTAQQMANCLPVGRAWASKNIDESNLRRLIRALAVAPNRVQQQVELLNQEFRIRQTYDLLEDWEESVGIPDVCIGSSETLEQRRQAVIDRLGKKPIVTLAEVQAYIDELFPGYEIKLYPGTDYYTFEYKFEVPFLGAVSQRFILVVEIPNQGETFEYSFEVPFVGVPDTTLVQCALERVIPANVALKFVYVDRG